MPSEQENDRDRQLEALRRHMIRLDSQWDPPEQLGIQAERLDAEPAGRRRPPLRWLLLVGLLVVVALVGGVVVGAVAWSDSRTAPDARRATAPASTERNLAGSSAPPVATPACKTAVVRANTMLASAVRLRGALAEQNRILNDRANRGRPVGQVLEKLAAPGRVGASEMARFDRALDAYRQVVDRCDLRAP